ncbi:MAG: hypothetical protein O3C63_04645 [Cyanobacteria bacterium]|nr:hypothetical protein [Cyanobacteriota bacterium]
MSETLGKASTPISGVSTGRAIKPVLGKAAAIASPSPAGDTPGLSQFSSPGVFAESNTDSIFTEFGKTANAAPGWPSTMALSPYQLQMMSDYATQQAINQQIAAAQKNTETETDKETGKKVKTEEDSASQAIIDKNVNVEHKAGSVAAGEKASGDSNNGSGLMSEENVNGELAKKLNSKMAEELAGLDIVVADQVAGAAGWFSSNMSIALSKDGTMATMFHEVGHALQHKLGGGLGAARNGGEGGWGDAKMNGHMDTIRDKMVSGGFQMGELNGGYGWNNQNKGGSHDQAEEYAEAFSMWATQREEFENQFGSEIAADFDEFFGKESQQYDETEPIQEKYPDLQPMFNLYNPAAMRLLWGLGLQYQIGPAFQPNPLQSQFSSVAPQFNQGIQAPLGPRLGSITF